MMPLICFTHIKPSMYLPFATCPISSLKRLTPSYYCISILTTNIIYMFGKMKFICMSFRQLSNQAFGELFCLKAKTNTKLFKNSRNKRRSNGFYGSLCDVHAYAVSVSYRSCIRYQKKQYLG